MPNEFFSPEGDLEKYYATEYWLIDQYIGDSLWTWGPNSFGQLGDNNTSVLRSIPVTTFAGGTNWKQVDGQNDGVVAIKIDGTLWVWGNNRFSRLGTNDINSKATPVTTFAGGTNWKHVSGGRNHTAAIKTDGTLWTWGYNTAGQLGNNANTTRATPVTTFSGGTTWKQVSVGYQHTSAIKTDGTLWTWGLNTYGQLGTNETATTRITPVTTFAGGNNWKQVSCGYDFTVSVKTDGTLWTWGRNNQGQLGDNTFTNRTTPVTTLAGGTTWKQVSGGDFHTAAIKTDGTLWTWGYNSKGQLGYIIKEYMYTPVTTFAGGTNWSDTDTGQPEELYTIFAGLFHTMAIKTNGTLWTWGTNNFGQLGLNDQDLIRSTPVTTFAGGTTWKQVSGGDFHTAAIKTDGTLWTWGRNDNGQLGNNETATRITPVTTFSGGTNWKQVSCGYKHTAAIKTDGTLWTWGVNDLGQLGRITTFRTPVTTFAGGTNWSDTATGQPEELYTIFAGNTHTAAIKTDGTLWVWGGSGGSGNDTSTNRSTPVTTFAGGTTWKQVSCGFSNTAAIKTDGTLWTWGINNNGQLGDNTSTFRSTPVTTFAGGTDWKQVSCGYLYAAAIKTDGTLWSWGYNSSGQLGTNASATRITPVTTFAGGTTWKQVSCGKRHTGAIKTDGTLWAWGTGTQGQLGTNANATRITPVTTFAGGTTWKQVSCGNDSTMSVKTDGTLWTWGSNDSGKLGDNTTTFRSTPVTTFAGGTNWKQVSSGSLSFYTSAIKTDGTLWTWGSNSSGQLGINDTGLRITPVTTFAGGTTWKQISAGTSHTVVLRDDGVNKELYLFGLNSSGQLGNNNVTNLISPFTVDSETTWKHVDCAKNNTVAIKTDGTLWTWGRNDNGQLGTNETTIKSTPVTTFAGGTDWKQVSSGSFHMSAIKTDGTLWAWGRNNAGQLGRITTFITPVTTFAGGTNWSDTATGQPEELHTISAGLNNTVAIKTDGTLWVWGRNTNAQLGTSNFENIVTPVTTFAGGTTWKQVSTAFNSGQHTAAIKTDGTLWTWGLTTGGQLGTNDNTTRITPVTTFAGGTTWKQVSCGESHSAAIKTDGTLWVWGGNFNLQLGDNTITTRSTPVTTFAGGTDWKQVSCGNNNTGAIKTDGTLWVWGNNFNGQLGLNNSSNRQTPVTTFAGGTNWKQVSAGFSNMAAIKTDGTLWTWGYNSFARLGDNTSTNRSTPVTTFSGGTNWLEVDISFSHTAAIKTDGTLWTWGRNESAQLGTNDVINRSTPVTTFAGGTNWKQVSSGFSHTVALRDDGVNKELYLFGDSNYGEIGTNTSNLRPFSVGVSTLWKQVSGGDFHTAAIKTDGTLWTWGTNNVGELGDNTSTTKFSPVTTFAGGTDWKQVSAGTHTVALRDDGINKQLYVFGSNNSTQLGLFINQIVPNSLLGNNWKQVSGGALSSVAVKTDGTLWYWGNTIYNPTKPPYTTERTWKQASGSQSYAAISSGINPDLPIS